MQHLWCNVKVIEDSFIGERLELARKKKGLSLRGLSEALGGSVSHETIRKYEKGLLTPDSTALIALRKVLGVSLTYLMSPQRVQIGEVDFRKKSRTKASDRAAVRTEVLELLERYFQVEDILGSPGEEWSVPDLGLEPSEDPSYAENVAIALRERWRLGSDAISDLTELLEERGIKVLFPEVSVDISGLTCLVERVGKDPVPVIVVNKEHTLERRRLTLAHELGHRVLDCRGMSGKRAESLCNRFAGAFLVPASRLRADMGPNRRSVAYREIMLVKRIFRVSAASMLMRLEQVGIMDQHQRDWFFRTTARAWRSEEPDPLEDPAVKEEVPRRFDRLVYRALAEDLISTVKAAELLRVTSLREIEFGLKGPDEASR